MAEVVCLGQFTADVVVKHAVEFPERGKALFVDEIVLQNGGCACNSAVALGKLGVSVAAMGKVGRDAFGDFLLGVLREAGVEVSAMVRDPEVTTSTTAVMVAPDGERSFLHSFGGNARMTEDCVDEDVLGKARILHMAPAFLVPGLDGEPMARILARARSMGVTTCLDTAWDARGRWMSVLAPCLEHLDYFIPSLEEARMLSGEDEPERMAASFLRRGARAAVIKLGDRGCLARTAREEFRIPAFPVPRVVDTIGAGDAFAAGFLAGLLGGRGLEGACRLGNAVGASCVGAAGMSGIRPLAETIEAYGL